MATIEEINKLLVEKNISENKFYEMVDKEIADAEKNNEPLTEKEAEEVVFMTLKAEEIRNQAQAEYKPNKTKAKKVRKVDDEKLEILNILAKALSDNDITPSFENEVKLHFNHNDKDYSITLTRHKKKG